MLACETQLRELFQQLDQLYAHYPDEFPDEYDTDAQLALMEADRTYGQLMAQVHVLAEAADIPLRHICEIDRIVERHHYDAHLKFAYRQIEQWLSANISLKDLSVTRGIKWPRRPGYHVPAVFQIAFSRSNLASGSMSSQQPNAERALEADKIRSPNLYFRPFYAQFLHFRPHYGSSASPMM